MQSSNLSWETVSPANSHNECGYKVSAKEDENSLGYLTQPPLSFPALFPYGIREALGKKKRKD